MQNVGLVGVTAGHLSSRWRAASFAMHWAPPVVSAASLFCAAVFPQGPGRETMLAVSVVSGSSWLAVEGALRRRSAVSAQLLLGLALLVLVAVPALLLLEDPGLYSDGRLTSLSPGLALWSLGIHAMVSGSILADIRRSPSLADVRRRVPVRRIRGDSAAAELKWWAAAWALALISSALFLVAAGGARDYFSSLDQTGANTRGLTYLIWGLLFGKFATLSYLWLRWRAGLPIGRVGAAMLGMSLVLVSLVGSRLLLLVAVLQTLLLAIELKRPQRSLFIGAAVMALVVPAVAVGLGELRRWQGTERSESFPAYLTNVGLPNLAGTLVNQYADGVRLAALARDVVPAGAPYEYGKEALRVVLQPLPSAVRPGLERSPPVKAVFTSGRDSGNALPVPVVGHLQGGMIGVIVLSLALGAAARAIDRLLDAAREPAAVLALLASVTGVVMIFRGSLAQGVALATIDVVGLYLVARLLLRSSSPTTMHAR